jgi:MATE family multidrug resistance protein
VSRASLRRPHDREITALAVPALGALIADPLLSLIDTGFVARIGGDALGALGVATAVFSVAFWVFAFLEYGTTATIARAVGAGDDRSAARVAVTALATAAAAGLVAVAVLEAFTGPILSAMGAGGGVKEEAATYLRIRALAAPAVLTIRAGHGIFRGRQNTVTPFVVSVALNGVNLVLDPLLIFGAGWGIAGAAWATVAAQWAGAVAFLVLLLRRRARPSLRGVRPEPREVRAFLGVGRDLAVRTGALLAVVTLASAIAARVSDAAIAAHQVLTQVWVLLALAVDALAIAAQAMVGRHLGRADGATAREVADRLLAVGIVVGMGFTALLAALYPVLPGWFGEDPAVAEAIRSGYWWLVAGQPVAAAVFVWDGVFIGAGDFRFLAVAMVAAGVVGAVVLALVLPLGWGLPGVWAGITALLVARAVTLGWRRTAAGGPLRRRPPA